MEKNIKRAKLHGKYRSWSNRPGRDVAWLNMHGLWLERAGFCTGREIEIEVENGRLTIRAL
jgi:hypothetical protein